jgi:glycosyltransferase involved in cell wall biosynthesis
MQASIIIRTYNEARHLKVLLDGIRNQTLAAAEYEVILVDSGSQDRTLEIARQGGCRILNIKPEEFSFGRSLNLGCEAARGRNLVFISGHCVPVKPTWLEDLIRPLGTQGCALTYGRQQGGERTKFSEEQLFLKYFPPNDEPPPNVFFCNNANAAVIREVWERFRYDETLTGLEDMEFGKRLTASGLKVKYVPGAGVYHYHHETWRNIRRRYEREAIALQKIMPEVQVQASDAMRYFMAGVFNDWAKALGQNCFMRYAREIVFFRFSQYYGAWRGNHIHRKLSKRAKEKYFYPR